MNDIPWNFEPCSPEGATDPAGNPWPHAVRGRKPAGRVVYGYGATEPTAWQDAERKAQQYDAREAVGQRGEAIVGAWYAWNGEKWNKPLSLIGLAMKDEQV